MSQNKKINFKKAALVLFLLALLLLLITMLRANGVDAKKCENTRKQAASLVAKGRYQQAYDSLKPNAGSCSSADLLKTKNKKDAYWQVMNFDITFSQAAYASGHYHDAHDYSTQALSTYNYKLTNAQRQQMLSGSNYVLSVIRIQRNTDPKLNGGSRQ
jgi:hypothetical protein